jgi:hypothetical protein
MNILRFLLMSILASSVGAGAGVSKKPVKLNDLPAAVRKTVEDQKGAANISRLEKFEREGSQMYELELSGGGSASKIVLIEAAGKIVEIKKPIKLSAVSKAAKAVIESSVGNGIILTLTPSRPLQALFRLTRCASGEKVKKLFCELDLTEV